MGPSFARYYSETLVFLGTAGVVVPFFKKMRLSPVHGFLAAGLALGPFGLGKLAEAAPWVGPLTINDVEEVSQVAELGVVFLMFMIGMELSLDRLWKSRRAIFGLGAVQVAACSAALALCAWAIGQTPAAAIVLGAAFSLSSTAIAMPSLAEKHLLESESGRASFAVLLFQDLAAAPLLFMVSMLTPSDADIWETLLRSLAPGAAAVAAVVAMGRLVMRPLFRWVAAARSPELFMATCLLVILGTAFVTAAGHQSMALGAFIAGLLLAETEFRRQIEALIDPFKGLLLGLFFLCVGASLDLGQVMDALPATLGATVVLLAIKTLLIFGAARLSGLRNGPAQEVALTLAGGGEFAFVLLSPSISGHILSPSATAVGTAAVTLSMTLIPILVGVAARINQRVPRPEALASAHPSAEDARGAVLIAGYGHVGVLVARMLSKHGIPYIAVDDDIRLVLRARKRAASRVFYGDAANPELLRRCDVAETQALVITVNDREAAIRVAEAARQESPSLPIIARALDLRHAKRLYRAGATDAVPEDIEPSLHLSELALLELGVPATEAIAFVRGQRDVFRSKLGGKGRAAKRRRAIREPYQEAEAIERARRKKG